MKSSKRALRRHHRQRMQQQALRSLVFSLWGDETRRRCVGKWHDNLKKCSCWMCGNPRKYGGEMTRQERRSLEAANQEAALN
jgi:hypothetical protein